MPTPQVTRREAIVGALLAGCAPIRESATSAARHQEPASRPNYNGLLVSIAVPRITIEAGDRVDVAVFILNASRDARRIYYHQSGGLALGIDVESARGVRAPHLARVATLGNYAKSRELVLDAGAVINDAVCLTSLFDLTGASSYVVQLRIGSTSHEDFGLEQHLTTRKPLPEPAPIQFSHSNQVHLTVVHPTYLEPQPRPEPPKQLP